MDDFFNIVKNLAFQKILVNLSVAELRMVSQRGFSSMELVKLYNLFL